jgi:hypothetical protein
MAGSRDVLNAFKLHVGRLLEQGRVDDAAAAWRDFVDTVLPSLPERHRDEALALHAEFRAAHARDR